MKIISKIIEILAKYGWTTTLVVLAAFALGFTWSSSDNLYANIRLFDRVALMVNQNYVENIDEAKMVKAGIDGMLSRLDNYTRFLDGADYMRLLQETDGRFDGIGIGMEYHRDSLTVISVIEGTPGYRAGIKPGDKVVAIDTNSTFGLDIKDIKLLMRGPRGSAITLTIISRSGLLSDITVEREDVELKAVPYFNILSGNIGYIRLIRFSEGCSNELKEAIRKLKKRGMNSLVLDLRDNPGGLLIEAIEAAGLFLPEGSDIVETRGRNGSGSVIYASSNFPQFSDGKIAVLVNSQTASAAEILAGAIQDHDRGVVIGTSTYGKGLVQQVLQFSDDSALKITTSKYYLPSGRCLQKPDWSSFELLTPEYDKQIDTIFATSTGRPVFGGGGILPDLYIEEQPLSDFVDALKRESIFFDFASRYLAGHEIKADFNVDDQLVSEFENFVSDRDFQYIESEREAYSSLKENMTVWDKETGDALNTIDRKLAAKEQWRFQNHYMEISRNIKEAILLQKFGESAMYDRLWLVDNPEIEEALDILVDSDKYSSILAFR